MAEAAKKAAQEAAAFLFAFNIRRQNIPKKPKYIPWYKDKDIQPTTVTRASQYMDIIKNNRPERYENTNAFLKDTPSMAKNSGTRPTHTKYGKLKDEKPRANSALDRDKKKTGLACEIGGIYCLWTKARGLGRDTWSCRPNRQ
jgi:hypothetical protein